MTFGRQRRRSSLLDRDLFFGVKIGNTLRALGYRVTICRQRKN